MFKEIRILTADLQVRRLFVLADGAACGAQVLTCVRVLDVLQGEGRHARVTPHHHAPVQALEESAHVWLGQRQTLALLHRSLHIHICRAQTPGGGRTASRLGGQIFHQLKRLELSALQMWIQKGPAEGTL